MNKWKETLLTALLILLGALLVGGANPFSGEALGPLDVLMAYPGYYEGGKEITPHYMLRSDILDALLPAWRFFKSELTQGRVPLWNPLPAGGEPALLNLPNGYFSLRYLMFLIFNDGLGFTLGLILQWTVAGLGTFLFCRSYLGWLSSLFRIQCFMGSLAAGNYKFMDSLDDMVHRSPFFNKKLFGKFKTHGSDQFSSGHDDSRRISVSGRLRTAFGMWIHPISDLCPFFQTKTI